MMNVLTVTRRAQGIRRGQGAGRCDLRAPSGRAAGAARSERRRQDDADPGDRRPGAAGRRRDPAVRSRRSTAGARRRNSASCRRRSRSTRCSRRARTSRSFGGLHGLVGRRSREAGGLGARPHRARRSRERAGQAVLRRHAAPAEHRVRRAPSSARRAARRADRRRRSAEPRSHLRHAGRRWRASGVSLLLTTHHLEEAEARCSRTVIIDHGKVIAAGTLPELVDQTVGRFRLVTLRLTRRSRRPTAARLPGAVAVESMRRTARVVRRGCATSRWNCRRCSTRFARRADGRRRRGAGPEPAGGVHPPDRKGAAGMMATLLRIGWTNLRRDRVAPDAHVPAADRVLLDLRHRVRQPGRCADCPHPRRGRGRGSLRVEPAARRRAAERERACACGRRPTPTATGPALDRAAAEQLGQDGDVPVAIVHPARVSATAFAKNGFRRRRRRRFSCCPTCPIRSRRRWCSGCCRRWR